MVQGHAMRHIGMLQFPADGQMSFASAFEREWINRSSSRSSSSSSDYNTNNDNKQ